MSVSKAMPVSNGLLLSILIYIYSIKVLGPVQLYMGRMLTDVLQMLFIFLVTMLSFAMALTRLYSYYHDMVRIHKKTEEQQPEAFERY